MAVPQRFTSMVTKKEQLRNHFVRLVLQNPEGFLYKAGQYISLVVGEGVRRPYSVSNWPSCNAIACEAGGENSGIELLVDTKSQGPGSKFVENLKVGDSVEFWGPYGKFIIPDDIHGNIWFLGTGSGVAPLKSQIEYLINSGVSHKTRKTLAKTMGKIRLIFGTRYEQDLVFFNHFVNFARTVQNFYYHIALSQPSESFNPQNIDSDKEAHWGEYWHKGYITEIAQNLLQKEKPDFVFLCGHPGMMETAIELLTGAGADPKNILFEKFS